MELHLVNNWIVSEQNFTALDAGLPRGVFIPTRTDRAEEEDDYPPLRKRQIIEAKPFMAGNLIIHARTLNLGNRMVLFPPSKWIHKLETLPIPFVMKVVDASIYGIDILNSNYVLQQEMNRLSCIGKEISEDLKENERLLRER